MDVERVIAEPATLSAPDRRRWQGAIENLYGSDAAGSPPPEEAREPERKYREAWIRGGTPGAPARGTPVIPGGTMGVPRREQRAVHVPDLFGGLRRFAPLQQGRYPPLENLLRSTGHALQ